MLMASISMVAYADSDDLAMFVLSHPGASIVSPQEAVRRVHQAGCWQATRSCRP